MLEILIGRSQNGAEGRDKVGLGSIRRPVIGLALGGGAARGFAHIGIVRTLIAHGIVPNVVVGTSIGAVVGGAYAAGHLDTLEEWARSLQPRNILGYLDIRLNGSGLIGGDKLAAQLEAAIGPTLIEDLPLKFATVATEVRTGHEIWLTHGRMVEAMRASYALPGIFSPVLVGDRWLVDGAMVNPVPVSAARALGAEIVIAANLSSDVFTHSTTIYSHGAPPVAPEVVAEPPPPPKRGFGKLFSAERTMKREFFGGGGRPGISSVMVDAFNIMQDRITRARLAGDPPDLLISPRVGQIGWFDFHRASDLIAFGARAAERAIDSIQEAIHILAPAGRPGPEADSKPGPVADAEAVNRLAPPRSGGLDVVAQRFLLHLVFADPPLDDVADRDQADNPFVLDHRQMPEFAQRHHFHDRGDRIGRPATDDLARHHRADRLVEHASAAIAEHADDVALRQDAFDAAFAHHQYGADFPLPQNLDRSRKLCARLDALDVMSFGIEDCTYRHCRLPEADRALERARSLFP